MPFSYKITVAALLYFFFIQEGSNAGRTIWTGEEYGFDPVQFEEDDDNDDEFSGDVIHGNWGSWNSWSKCTKKCCGKEKRIRVRYCNNPPPDRGGRPCEGLAIETKDCVVGDLKSLLSRIVGGRSTKIQDWPWQVGLQSNSDNGIFCGGSLLNQEWVLTAAHCISQFANPGINCSYVNSGDLTAVLGESDLKKVEGNEVYKIAGQWGAWSKWTVCSKSCDIGVSQRTRYCNNPEPQNGGRTCVGKGQETRRCSLRTCPRATTSAAPTTSHPLICGRPKRSRIVGGEVASNRDWPWQVGLQTEDDDFIFCGGSLINREWVLTAAHCIYRNNPSRQGCVPPFPGLRVILGEFDVENIDGHEVQKTISEVCMHHAYDHSIYNNDIALLRFSTPLPGFNETMSPVCLPTASSSFPPGTTCSVTGWGKTSQSGPGVSKQLRVAHVPIINHATCREQYWNRTGDIVTDKMICAGYQEGKVDSCKGDSGGPFVCKEGGRHILVGATSWGVGCAQPGQPGVYTDIKDFLGWIQDLISSNPEP